MCVLPLHHSKCMSMLSLTGVTPFLLGKVRSFPFNKAFRTAAVIALSCLVRKEERSSV